VQVYVNAYILKSIGEFAPTRWAINEEGVLEPTLLLKQTGWDKLLKQIGWDKDSSRVLPFEPETSRTHRKVADREDAGLNFTTASLRIKPKASTAKATERNTKR